MLRNISLITVFFLSTLIASGVYAEKRLEKNTQVNVIITFNVKPDKLDSFVKIMDSVKTSPSTVKGWKSVEIYRDAQKPTVFTLVELWESRELHKSHLDNIVKAGVWDNISKHLVSAPVSSYFKEL